MSHPTHSCFQLFSNALQRLMSYREYLCNVSCRVTGIYLNRHFDLPIVRDFRHVRTFFFFQIKIFVSESSDPHKNSAFSYGTTSINGTYLFNCVVHLFFFQKENEHQVTKMRLLFLFFFFTFNLTTFTIHNSHTNLIENCVIMSSLTKYIWSTHK